MTTFSRYGRLIAVIFGFILAGCQTASEHPMTISARQDLLRVGVATDYPPVIFRQDHAIAGVEADFARLLTKAIGRKLDLSTSNETSSLTPGSTIGSTSSWPACPSPASGRFESNSAGRI